MKHVMLTTALLALTAPVFAAEREEVGRTTFYIEVEGEVPTGVSTQFDHVKCVHRGTTFVLDDEQNIMVTARHLFAADGCELVGLGQTLEGDYRELLERPQIRVWRGPDPDRTSNTLIVDGLPHVQRETTPDLATFRVQPVPGGFNAPEICLPLPSKLRDLEMWGYANPTIRPQVRLFLGRLSTMSGQIEIAGQADSGVSGGPLYDDRNRVIGVLRGGHPTYQNQTVATMLADVRHFSGVVLGNCANPVEPIDRIAIRLDDARVLAREGRVSYSVVQSATFEINRGYYIQEFQRNEQRIKDFLGSGRIAEVESDGFYRSATDFRAMLPQPGAPGAANSVPALRAFSANAYYLAEYEASRDAMLLALEYAPQSVEVFDGYLARLMTLDRFRDALDAVVERQNFLQARPTDVTERIYWLSSAGYYARALTEVHRNDEAEALYTELLRLAEQWQQETPDEELAQMRHEIAGDRIQLLVDRRNNTALAEQDARAGIGAIQEMMAASERRQQEAERAGNASAGQNAARRAGRLRNVLARLQNNRAWTLSEAGEVSDALVLAQSANENARTATPQRPLMVAVTYANMGAAQSRLGGDQGAGLANLRRAFEIYSAFDEYERSGSFRARLARIQDDIAFAYFQAGDRARALESLRSCLTTWSLAPIKDNLQIARANLLLGYYYLGEADQDRAALEQLNKADQENRSIGSVDPDTEILIDLYRGEAMMRTGDRAIGRRSVERARDALAAGGAPFVVYWRRSEMLMHAQRLLQGG